MRSCAWCQAAATTDVEVEPAEYRHVNGIKKCVKFAVLAPACELHAGQVELGIMDGPQVRTPARAGSRTPTRQQMTIYDAIGGA